MTKIAAMSYLLLASLLTLGCINPLPGSVDATASDPDALAMLMASADAHGGDGLFASVQRINVDYGDAQWLGRVWVFQPILVDRGYRGTSSEVINFGAGWPTTFQTHTGPDGEKDVLWPADQLPDSRARFAPPIAGGAAVLYNGKPTADPDLREQQEEAAAMVAEAYRMFLTAPFYFTQRAGRGTNAGSTMIAVMSEPDEVEGIKCDQVLVELRPGFGNSPVDRVQIAIAQDTKLVRRVRFSLDGFRGTRGATADVVRAGFIDVGGLILPTEFVEIVTHPLDREVHRWRALGIGVQHDGTAEQSQWPSASHKNQ